MRLKQLTAGCCLTAILAAGCSGLGGGGNVTGSVTLNGEPLAGAQVQLVPASDPSLGTYSATSGPDGAFSAEGDARTGGAVRPGNYVVTVTKLGPDPKGGGEMARVPVLPAIYGDQKRTPFRVTVKAGTNRLEPFALTSKR
jgi:hypothetical protein